jgi:4-amino-4-deoxy-L-arabinose transferase-like glycosyltransferase
VAERLRRIPPSVAALLAVSGLLAVIWAVVTPAFQAPDEHRHFAYVESLAARHALPGDVTRKGQSTQLVAGMEAVNSNQVAAQLPVKPEWSEYYEQQWRRIDATAPNDDGGGPTPASTYPPTAYIWQAIGYVAGSSGSVYDELLGARLMSALWLPVTVLAVWLLAGELLERRRLLQTTAASVPALLPMVAFISASVSPDAMLYAVWSLALWLGVRCVKRGVPVGEGAAFFALVGIACTIKATSFALLPGAALVAVVGIVARRPWRVPRVLKLAAAVIVPLALTIGVWLVVAKALERPAAAQLTETTASSVSAGTNIREFLSYVWQYYLPRAPGQNEFSKQYLGEGYPTLQVWITQAWGAFGWLEVKFDRWVYKVLLFVTAGVFAGGIVALVRARRAVDLRVAAFLALVFVALLGGLHWTDYHQVKIGNGFMQARYLFPVIGIFGVAAAGALSLLPVRRRGVVASVAIGALFAFHVLCLGLVVERFYA